MGSILAGSAKHAERRAFLFGTPSRTNSPFEAKPKNGFAYRLGGIRRFARVYASLCTKTYDSPKTKHSGFRSAYRLGGIRRFAWVYASLCTKTYESPQILRTLADSCSPLLAHCFQVYHITHTVRGNMENLQDTFYFITQFTTLKR